MEDLRSVWRSHVEFGLANPELYALLNASERSDSSSASTEGLEVLLVRIRGAT